MKSPHETGAIRGLGAGGRHLTKPELLQQYRVVCADFRAFSKNTLQGFATLRVDPLGLVIQGCSVYEKNDKRWVNFPSKPYTAEDGAARWQS